MGVPLLLIDSPEDGYVESIAHVEVNEQTPDESSALLWWSRLAQDMNLISEDLVEDGEYNPVVKRRVWLSCGIPQDEWADHWEEIRWESCEPNDPTGKEFWVVTIT